MTRLEEALITLVRFLDNNGLPYMTIGGIAGLLWGVPRATFDVDVTIWASGRDGEIALRLSKAFESRAPDPAGFVRDTGVLPIKVGDIPADIVFGRFPYEEAAMRRAARMVIGGQEVRVCTPEDLILHKIISERPKDLEDVRALARLRGRKLDRSYLDPRVRGLAADLARPEIWEAYNSRLDS